MASGQSEAPVLLLPDNYVQEDLCGDMVTTGY